MPRMVPLPLGFAHREDEEAAMRATTKATVARARGLRREMSPPEARLWQVLRARPDGLKFRRQHPVGPYVLDFYCPAARLGIEVDGVAHEMGGIPERDERRDRWLAEQGVGVLRVNAGDVTKHLEAVVMHILQACGSSSSLSRSDGEGDQLKAGGGAIRTQ